MSNDSTSQLYILTVTKAKLIQNFRDLSQDKPVSIHFNHVLGVFEESQLDAIKSQIIEMYPPLHKEDGWDKWGAGFIYSRGETAHYNKFILTSYLANGELDAHLLEMSISVDEWEAVRGW